MADQHTDSPWASRCDALAGRLAQVLTGQGWLMATAESCTGGLIASRCTELSGSSRWFDRGWVTYSNQAKTDLLGVPADLIDQHGAVSEPVALAMAQGALERSAAQVAVAVTGVAGPTGGSTDKPVGTVWLAWAVQGQPPRALRVHCPGDRAAVRWRTCVQALEGVLASVESLQRSG